MIMMKFIILCLALLALTSTSGSPPAESKPQQQQRRQQHERQVAASDSQQDDDLFAFPAPSSDRADGTNALPRFMQTAHKAHADDKNDERPKYPLINLGVQESGSLMTKRRLIDEEQRQDRRRLSDLQEKQANDRRAIEEVISQQNEQMQRLMAIIGQMSDISRHAIFTHKMMSLRDKFTKPRIKVIKYQMQPQENEIEIRQEMPKAQPLLPVM